MNITVEMVKKLDEINKKHKDWCTPNMECYTDEDFDEYEEVIENNKQKYLDDLVDFMNDEAPEDIKDVLWSPCGEKETEEWEEFVLKGTPWEGETYRK